ncbi:MAG TPA: galactose-1-phosphate uridylyltransferase [Candidatus Acidoferrales bacterium]|nr:galactose-1-phosphate uridylyltransferase [Candidatus Acidoferrales bacterium]
MSELHWHPLLEEWVTVAPARQERSYHPDPAQCPLCPTPAGGPATEIPVSDYHIAVFENRFPAFAPGHGRCEVVCYTSDHASSLGAQSVERIRDLIEVWADRTRELSRLPEVRYVLVFENRGEEIGVTLTHPHGQIYAYPFLPSVIDRELRAGARHRRLHGDCLYCRIIEREWAGERMVDGDQECIAFVPDFARWPFEVHLAPRSHLGSLSDLGESQAQSLARLLQSVLRRYDRLFDAPMPYVMAIHQRPVGRGYAHHHLHLEFYAAGRARGKLKHLAGSELGAGAFIVDVAPAAAARRLRDAG